ncbi:hypothetical protein VM57_06810 [Stenotrophomonas maltophilia]|uniref:Uncharacterized protein n=1 Tax=Stenotrophomonas maltophilia TaxID=40324 RepID=A0A0F5ZR27_STEMA|nr:hypothetical protein VM57_06810 [Stenotrophomonas maltophilia]
MVLLHLRVHGAGVDGSRRHGCRLGGRFALCVNYRPMGMLVTVAMPLLGFCFGHQMHLALGQRPGRSCRISGCMGHTYIVPEDAT